MVEIPYLKDFLKSIKKAPIDDFIDRVNYYYTAMLLTFFAILTGAKQTIGKPIECMMPAEFSPSWNDYVREFCYVSSTYFVSSNKTTTSLAENENKIGHGYYQWVPFILIIQALLIYLPNLLWKSFQKSQTIDFQHVVEKAKSLRFIMGDEHQKGVKDIVAYLKQRLQHQGTKAGYSYVGFGMKSSLLHILTKVLTIFVMLTELHLMNKIFGNGDNSFWGLTMLVNGLTNSRWEETGVFPRRTFCDFRQPIFGNEGPERTVQCVLMVNMINEKIFVFVWLWLAVSAIVSILDLFYTIISLFTPPLRRRSIRNYVKASNHSVSACNSTTTTSSGGYMNDDLKLIDFAAAVMGADGVHLFQFIKSHAGSLIASEIGTALFDTLYNEETRPPAHFDTTIHTFGEKQGKSHC